MRKKPTPALAQAPRNPKTVDESLRVGYQTCDASMDVLYQAESLFQAIDKLSFNLDDQSISGLASIGRGIVATHAARIDSAMLRMVRTSTDLEVIHG